MPVCSESLHVKGFALPLPPWSVRNNLMRTYATLSVSFTHRPVPWCGLVEAQGRFFVAETVLHAFHGLSPLSTSALVEPTMSCGLWKSKLRLEEEKWLVERHTAGGDRARKLTVQPWMWKPIPFTAIRCQISEWELLHHCLHGLDV